MNAELDANSEADGLADASPMLRTMTAIRNARRHRRSAWKNRPPNKLKKV